MSWPSAPLGSVATLERDGENPSALHCETRYVGLEHIDGDGIIASAATVGTAELKSTKFEVVQKSMTVKTYIWLAEDLHRYCCQILETVWPVSIRFSTFGSSTG